MSLITNIIVGKKNRDHREDNLYEINIESIPINGKISIHRIGKSTEYAIYKLTNKINNKVYIGITSVDPVARWQGGKGYSNNENMSYDINKYGWNNFRKEIIAYADKPIDAYKLEVYFIKKYNSVNPIFGYNKTEGGDVRGKHNSLTREKMSKSHTGMKETIETKKKKSNKIIAIKDNDLLICDSGKLFGDFIGASKDYVKNCLRRPCKLYDYKVFYYSKEKRDEIIEKKLNNPYGKGWRHIETCEYLDSHLDETTGKISDQNNEYNVKYLIYANNDKGYNIVDSLI